MAITREKIESILDNSVVAVIKGILFLYERQTADEIGSKHTKYDNERGFRVNHARRGTELAEKILNGETLTVSELSEARGICKNYAGTQLLARARAVHSGV
jgi:hypothetical protein